MAKEGDPEFAEWLDAVKKAKTMFRHKAEKCRELENELELRWVLVSCLVNNLIQQCDEIIPFVVNVENASTKSKLKKKRKMVVSATK